MPDSGTGDRGVRPGQVRVLEQAALGGRLGEPLRTQPVRVDRDQLARLDLAHERGPDDVQGGGLAGDDPAAVEPAEHQRAHAVAVAGRVERVLVHEHQRERAGERRQHLHRGGLDRQVRVRGEQTGDQVRVGGRAADVGDPEPRCLLGQLGGVDEVAVVAERDARPGPVGPEGGLRVLPGGGSGGRVAAVADGDVAAQAVQCRLVEDLGDEAEVLVHDERGAVADGDPGRLLPPVL
jgi:hypothetical protein